MEIIIVIAGIIILVQANEIKRLHDIVQILETERYNTRRVMYENGLIPKEFVDALEDQE